METNATDAGMSGTRGKTFRCDARIRNANLRTGTRGQQVISQALLFHTNGIENFWSLLKRGLNGTYVSVEPFHLFRYLDEQAFRFNNRKVTDGDRFEIALFGIVGRRVTYKALTGKEA